MTPEYHFEGQAYSESEPDQDDFGGPRERSLEAQAEPGIEALTEILSQEYKDLSHLDFERNLQTTGLLSSLKQAGIVPTREALAEREKVLKQPYLGAVLAHLDHNLLISPILMFSARDSGGYWESLEIIAVF
jgi:hypothetical protein